MNNLEDLFKKLIIADICLAGLVFLIGLSGTNFGLDQGLIEWQDYLLERYAFAYILVLIHFILAIICYVLLFKFKPISRSFFLWLTILGIPLVLICGPQIIDPVTGVLSGISGLISGALLIILYYTPIQDKFIESNINNTKKTFNLVDELENINRLYKDGLIDEDEFKSQKEKALNKSE